MAALDADIVILDLRSDAYLCLPEAAAALTLADGVATTSPSTLAALADAVLVCATPVSPRRPIPTPPDQELEDGGSGRLGDGLHFLRAVTLARRLGPQATIAELILALPPARGAPDIRRVAALTRKYKRWLPWAPGQGVCLYRAFVLLAFLRRAGQDATWVFGVRTWPFAAHCWLQIADAVLDDDPERVALYTPILAL